MKRASAVALGIAGAGGLVALAIAATNASSSGSATAVRVGAQVGPAATHEISSGAAFTVTGDAYTTPSGPYPAATCSGTPAPLIAGAVRCEVLSVHNNLKAAITVHTIGVTVDPTYALPPGCTATDLSLPSYTGSLTVGPGATAASPGEPIAANPDGTDPTACEGVAGHLVFSGTATDTEVWATSTKLVSSRDPSVVGEPVTYTAVVTATAAATQDPVPASPSGTMTFTDGGTVICSAVPVTSSSSTTAISRCSPPPYEGAATHRVLAAFSPNDGQDEESGSNLVTQIVQGASPRPVPPPAPSLPIGAGCITTVLVTDLTVTDGQAVCVTSTGKVVGDVTVDGGGSLSVEGGTIIGGITLGPGSQLVANGGTNVGGIVANKPTSVTICGLGGPGEISVSGATGPVRIGGGGATPCASSTLVGDQIFTDNTGGVQIAGDKVIGSLSCSGNSPAPTDGGEPDSVVGTRSGQCSGGF